VTGVTSPLNRDGDFELDGVSPGHYPATIGWAGGECHFDLIVPAGDRPIIDLGTIFCGVR
jgi:hypothetical protein